MPTWRASVVSERESSPEISATGIWSASLRYGDPASAAEAATELEQLGFGAIWIPDVGGDVFGAVANLLRATTHITVATGILNIWMQAAADTAEQHARLTAQHGPRFLVGLGVSHARRIDQDGPGTYTKPLERMREYLDALDAAPTPLQPADRVIAALGPKMLELAGSRTAGSHPYLVTPEHTAAVRAALGPDKLVAAEQAVVLESDPATARAIARSHLALYLGLPNYSNNWKRIGFTDDDLEHGGSNRLVDALVAWGGESEIRSRIDAHRAAGADHVCIQALGGERTDHPLDQWRALAPIVLS